MYLWKSAIFSRNICSLTKTYVSHWKYSRWEKSVVFCFGLLLPQILDNFQNQVLTISKHPLHMQFDQFLAEIFEVKDKWYHSFIFMIIYLIEKKSIEISRFPVKINWLNILDLLMVFLKIFLLILVPLMVNRTIFGTNCSDFCYFHLQQINYQEYKRMVSCVFNLKYLSKNLSLVLIIDQDLHEQLSKTKYRTLWSVSARNLKNQEVPTLCNSFDWKWIVWICNTKMMLGSTDLCHFFVKWINVIGNCHWSIKIQSSFEKLHFLWRVVSKTATFYRVSNKIIGFKNVAA